MFGDKIKKIRKIKGFRQVDLGIRWGFPENSADSRIRKYEAEKMFPKGNILRKLTDNLSVDNSSLYKEDTGTFEVMAHILMDLEENHSLIPVEIDGEYYLAFNSKSPEYYCFLRIWKELKDNYCDNEYYIKKQSFFIDNDDLFEKYSRYKELISLKKKKAEIQEQIDSIIKGEV